MGPVIIPPALGVRPPSGADVILLEDMCKAFTEAGINPAPDFEAINWRPPSERLVVYREEVIGQLFEMGIPVDSCSQTALASPHQSSIDDQELDALLCLRDTCHNRDIFLLTLSGALDGILQRMFDAEKKLSDCRM